MKKLMGFILLYSMYSHAGPAIQSVSGNLNHKSLITLSGSEFGSKSRPAPVVWDDASGANPLDKWSEVRPNGGDSNYRLSYRVPFNGVGLPHNNITKYMAGAHGASDSNGYQVALYKKIIINSYPTQIYASWYNTVDPKWVFRAYPCGGDSSCDNNFKYFRFAATSSGDSYGNGWYLEYGNSTFLSKTSSSYAHLNDNLTPGPTLLRPDANNHGWGWESLKNPTSVGWVKFEVALNLTSDNSGYIKQWEDGKLVINYRGPTDKLLNYNSLPAERSIQVGGYSRNYGYSTNFRYYADIYVDTTLSRVVLANNADLSKATLIETQLPTAWSPTSISLNVNLGKFSSGTAYLFVVDANGVASPGKAITIGGAGAPLPVKLSVPAGVIVN